MCGRKDLAEKQLLDGFNLISMDKQEEWSDWRTKLDNIYKMAHLRGSEPRVSEIEKLIETIIANKKL